MSILIWRIKKSQSLINFIEKDEKEELKINFKTYYEYL